MSKYCAVFIYIFMLNYYRKSKQSPAMNPHNPHPRKSKSQVLISTTHINI